MEKNNNYVDKDQLVNAAVALDAAEYVIQEMQENYFDCFDSSYEDDKRSILWEYSRNRAKMAVLSILIYEISKAFKENKTSCYLTKQVKT